MRMLCWPLWPALFDFEQGVSFLFTFPPCLVCTHPLTSAIRKLTTLLTWFVHVMLLVLAADISRLQNVRNRKVPQIYRDIPQRERKLTSFVLFVPSLYTSTWPPPRRFIRWFSPRIFYLGKKKTLVSPRIFYLQFVSNRKVSSTDCHLDLTGLRYNSCFVCIWQPGGHTSSTFGSKSVVIV